jgi:hypothetical protein
MLEVAQVAGGIAIGLAWLGIWAGVLHLIGVAPILRTVAERRSRRERLQRLGEFRYIITIGVLGRGVAFGLAITSIDFISHLSHGWATELVKFAFSALFFFGLIQGFSGWRRAFRDPVPFPPDYPPAK